VAIGHLLPRALIRGERNPEKLADLAEGRLRAKIPELKLALEGTSPSITGSWWSIPWGTWMSWSGMSRNWTLGSRSVCAPC
jgi:hypothetical protein